MPSEQARAPAPPWRVPLADVVVPEEDIAAVAEAYRSGWLSMGPRTRKLEEDFAAYVDARHAVAVSSGTAALHLICLAAGLGPGDEVIVPSMTFVATANAVTYTGARAVFAEIAGPAEPWLCARAAEAAVGPRTRAILTVAYAGNPGAVLALRDLAERRGLLLLEDAAHAAGSRLDGRHLGTLGAAGAFSFFSNKNLAIGEGGMVVTDDADLAARVRLLRSHGMTTLSWDRHRGHAARYDVVALGMNYRIDEPRAALALRRLGRLDDENRRRAEIIAAYREALADLPGLTLVPPDGDGLPAYHLFPILLDEGVDRDRFRALLAERGVQTSVHYPPVHRFSIYAEGAPSLPLTDAYGARSVTLPLFAHMDPDQRALVIDSVRAQMRALAPARG